MNLKRRLRRRKGNLMAYKYPEVNIDFSIDEVAVLLKACIESIEVAQISIRGSKAASLRDSHLSDMQEYKRLKEKLYNAIHAWSLSEIS